MKAGKTWRGLTARAFTMVAALAVGVGLACAKLPDMNDEQKAKAAEAKAKAAEATKKARESEEKAMDRVAERYKKEKGMKTAAAAPEKKKK